MRYTNVFCGRYTLATGTRVIAWFNIKTDELWKVLYQWNGIPTAQNYTDILYSVKNEVLYVINIVINILAVDIVKSYKENVDEVTDYNRDQLLIFHYICLVFGVVTVLSSAIFLVKMSQSEDFMQFMVKWNAIRCLIVFGAIVYVCAAMDHILTVAISASLLIIDLCASTYFTGVMSSYIKQLEDPSGQIYTSHDNSNRQPAVCLVSLTTTSQTADKIENVDEVSNSSPRSPEQGNTAIPDETTGIVNVAADEESKKDATEEKNHNSLTTTNNGNASAVNSTETQNSSSSKANDVDGDKSNEQAEPQPSLKEMPKEENAISESRGKPDSNNTHEKDDSELEEKTTSPDKEATSPDSNEVDSEIQENERNETGNSEKSGEVKGIENPAVDVSEVEPPSVVVIPTSPDQEAEINVDIR